MESLPDTKVIRTRFVIHFFAIFIFSIMLAFIGFREFTKIGLAKEISNYESAAEKGATSNMKLSRMNSEFRLLSSKLKDLKNFKEQPFNPNQFLIELSRMRTLDIVFDEINYDNRWDNSAKKEIYQIQINGKGKTTADIAELKGRLTIFELPKPYTIEVTEKGNPTKDAESGVFSFVILLKIKKGA